MMKKGCCSRSYDYMAAEKEVKSGSDVVQHRGSSSGSDMKNKMKERVWYGGAPTTSGMAAMYDADQLMSSWPPRHYTCTFCRRRFKSAQALGGHMNVHRRARALLRSQSISPMSSPPSSPWLPTCTATTTTAANHLHGDDPNFIAASPNPNYSLSIPSQSHLLHLPKMNITSSCSSNFPHKMMMMPVVAPACLNSQEIRCHGLGFGATELMNSGEKAKKNCIRADQHNLKGLTRTHQGLILNTGLVTRSANEEEIDLELRLGY